MTFFPEVLAATYTEHPHRIALRHDGLTMTYRELNRQVEQLAGHLQQQGVAPGATVAVCLPRSFEWIVASLATMRLGAAYVPLDLAWPEDRLRYVIADSGADVVIAGAEQLQRLATGRIGVDPSRDAGLIAAAPRCDSQEISADALAYVIYTSGSTGVPKGVEITRRNLTHLIAWHLEAFSVTEHDRATHLAGLGFDAAGWEVWPYLAAGASVSLVNEMVRTSPDLLQRWIVAEGITLGFVPTSLAAAMIGMDWPETTALRLLLTGGDALLKRPKPGLPFTLVNNYGPTECTVVATSGIVSAEGDTVPAIGSAIKGAVLYVLGDEGTRVTDGVTGELYIGGAGVGRGYRNLPELTRQSFLPDPFSATPGARLYRTGDRGVVLPEGQIAFRGRLDRQEKIRGQRLELDEITQVLHRHPSVAYATVVASAEAATDKQLIAYVLPVAGTHPVASELQEFVGKWLPGYMVPTQFVRLAAVPLTPNGKLDRSALERPTPQNSLAATPVREELTPIEETLLAMVRELLGTDQASIEDDFFLIGGHSLLGTQLVLRVRAAFGVDLTLRDLFEAATVEQLALKVESMLIAELEGMTEEEALRQAGG